MNRRLKIGCHFGLGQICPVSLFRLITLLAYLHPLISSVYLPDSPLPLYSRPGRLRPVRFPLEIRVSQNLAYFLPPEGP
jgi:hypothetical protein